MNIEANFNTIFKRFSYKIFQFSKIKNDLTENNRILVYKQTILPFVEYVSFLLYLNRKYDVDKLQKLQNNALRICFDIKDPKLLTVDALHERANIGSLLERREQLLMGVMFDLRKDTNLLSIAAVNTRQAEKTVFKTEIVHYDIYKRSPFYVGTQLWNTLIILCFQNLVSSG